MTFFVKCGRNVHIYNIICENYYVYMCDMNYYVLMKMPLLLIWITYVSLYACIEWERDGEIEEREGGQSQNRRGEAQQYCLKLSAGSDS